MESTHQEPEYERTCAQWLSNCGASAFLHSFYQHENASFLWCWAFHCRM